MVWWEACRGAWAAAGDAIGDRLEAGDCDVLAPRAVVSPVRKALLLARALIASLAEAPRRLPAPSVPLVVIRFPDDVLPLGAKGAARRDRVGSTRSRVELG